MQQGIFIPFTENWQVDKSAEGAIKQIKDKKYFESLEEYQDNLLLIGINYDKKTKEHVCKIEKY